jgi:hypothetical protein
MSDMFSLITTTTVSLDGFQVSVQREDVADPQRWGHWGSHTHGQRQAHREDAADWEHDEYRLSD